MRIGSPTKAHWESIAGGSVDTTVYRPALDANHVGAWYLDNYDGTQFPSAIPGSGSFKAWDGVSSGSVGSYDSPIFRGTKAATLVANTTDIVYMWATSSFSIGTTSPVTTEAIVYVPTNGYTALNQYHDLFAIADGMGGTWLSFMNFRIRHNNAYQIDYASNSYYSSANHYWDTTYAYGAGENQVMPNVPHHFMFTWTPSTTTAVYYMDGWQMGTRTDATNYANRGGAMTGAQIILTRDVYVADFRVSNIARPQSYAIAATRAMRRM